MLADVGLCLLLAAASTDEVTDDAVMDMEFLEYLGSWEGSDDEWLMFEKDAPQDDDDSKESDDEPKQRAPDDDDAS